MQTTRLRPFFLEYLQFAGSIAPIVIRSSDTEYLKFSWANEECYFNKKMEMFPSARYFYVIQAAGQCWKGVQALPSVDPGSSLIGVYIENPKFRPQIHYILALKSTILDRDIKFFMLWPAKTPVNFGLKKSLVPTFPMAVPKTQSFCQTCPQICQVGQEYRKNSSPGPQIH